MAPPHGVLHSPPPFLPSVPWLHRDLPWPSSSQPWRPSPSVPHPRLIYDALLPGCSGAPPPSLAAPKVDDRPPPMAVVPILHAAGLQEAASFFSAQGALASPYSLPSPWPPPSAPTIFHRSRASSTCSKRPLLFPIRDQGASAGMKLHLRTAASTLSMGANILDVESLLPPLADALHNVPRCVAPFLHGRELFLAATASQGQRAAASPWPWSATRSRALHVRCFAQQLRRLRALQQPSRSISTPLVACRRSRARCAAPSAIPSKTVVRNTPLTLLLSYFCARKNVELLRVSNRS
jgi:hypothetical protein